MSNYQPPNEYMDTRSIGTENSGISNQTSPNQVQLKNIRSALRSKTSFVTCPFCKNQGLTIVNDSCNFPNLACCIATTVILWAPFQFFRGKDLNCYDAIHKCANCGNVLGEYKAC